MNTEALNPNALRFRNFGGALLVVWLGTSVQLACADTRIDVFTDGAITAPEIPRTQIRLWNLAKPDELNATTPRYPPNPEMAQVQAKAWLASAEGKAFLLKMREAQKGLEVMYQCGVSRIPAIAFDNCRFVVYGTTDIAAAVQDYDQYRETHRAAE